MLMSQKTWDKLSDDQKAAVQKAARKAIDRQREINAANEKEIKTKLQGHGMQINPIKDPAAFRAKVKPVYDEFKPSIGAELFDQVLQAVQ